MSIFKDKDKNIVFECYLDLLYRLSINLRACPNEINYLNAIVSTVDEIKAKNIALKNESRFEETQWNLELKKIFKVKNISSNVVARNVEFNSSKVILSNEEFYVLILLFESAGKLMKLNRTNAVIAYMDVIHNFPIEIKKKEINKQYFWKGRLEPFIKKENGFFTKEEILILKHFCGIKKAY